MAKLNRKLIEHKLAKGAITGAIGLGMLGMINASQPASSANADSFSRAEVLSMYSDAAVGEDDPNLNDYPKSVVYNAASWADATYEPSSNTKDNTSFEDPITGKEVVNAGTRSSGNEILPETTADDMWDSLNYWVGSSEDASKYASYDKSANASVSASESAWDKSAGFTPQVSEALQKAIDDGDADEYTSVRDSWEESQVAKASQNTSENNISAKSNDNTENDNNESDNDDNVSMTSMTSSDVDQILSGLGTNGKKNTSKSSRSNHSRKPKQSTKLSSANHSQHHHKHIHKRHPHSKIHHNRKHGMKHNKRTNGKHINKRNKRNNKKHYRHFRNHFKKHIPSLKYSINHMSRRQKSKYYNYCKEIKEDMKEDKKDIATARDGEDNDNAEQSLGYEKVQLNIFKQMVRKGYSPAKAYKQSDHKAYKQVFINDNY